jgi:very-short-patch-repair endonuclease
MDDLKNAENLRRKEASLLEQEPSLQRLFGSRFQGLATDWEEILSTLDWTKKLQEFFGSHSIPDLFAELVSQGADAAPPNSELVLLYNSVLKDGSVLESRFDDGLSYDGKKLQESSIEAVSLRIEELRNRVESLQTWIDYKHMVDSFCQKGLTNFIDQLIKAKPSSSQLKDILHKTVDHEWVRAICAEDLNLARFRREDHEQLVADFRNLDRRLIRLSPSRVVQAANGRKPREIWITAKDSEIGALMKESAKRRRLLPIRKLFEMIPNLLFRLKPCLLMSPMSVSQFISPELMKFDIVLFDEASQIVPEDAVGAIYRGKTIVVAGDNRQLPPTPFFQKSAIEDYDWDEVSDDEVEVFDSILDECLGIGLPVKTLNWHYRSRHEELIAFSNDRFYENRLTTFPTAFSEDEELGVKLVHVPDGIYDRGGRRDNVKEAEVVTGLVFEHFRRYPEKSLGVVTFSISQMEAVDDAIELGLESQPELEQFFKGDRLQGFFVKNLENVQGDERDVIIFSVGYGRDLQGQMTMNFGPLNKLGGERRLNVAITRAKQKVILVASIKASDIDLKTAGAAGVLALKSYLEYAEKGIEVLDRTCQTQKGEEYESPLEEEVAAEIRRMGYEVVPQVGCSGYRIDLGVLDPLNSGRFVLGVECDGATYRSAHSARDRERLRQQMLENLGWKIHRIWTPSWVNLRESEVRRLRKAIEDACHSQPEGREPVSIASDSDLLQQNGITVQKAFPVGFEKIGVPYVTCRLKASFSPNVRVRIRRWPYQAIHRNQFHYSVNRAEQTRLLAILVKEEGPIHFDCAVQRLTAAWGLKRAGPNIVRAVREAVSSCCQTGLIEIKGDFLWPPTHKEIAVRMPVPDVPESMRRLEHIPPEEIEKAMQLIVTRAVGISVDSLVVETARIFGFSRTGNDIRAMLVKVCQKMLQDGALICKDSILTSTRIQ